METHLRAAGYLNIGLGIAGLVAVVIGLILFGGPGGVLLINAREGGSTSTLEGTVTAAVMIYLVLIAAPLILLGRGLLRVEEWARNLGMILSIVNMVHVPFGTVIAIHTLWVLTSFEVEPLFQAPLRRQRPRFSSGGGPQRG